VRVPDYLYYCASNFWSDSKGSYVCNQAFSSRLYKSDKSLQLHSDRFTSADIQTSMTTTSLSSMRSILLCTPQRIPTIWCFATKSMANIWLIDKLCTVSISSQWINLKRLKNSGTSYYRSLKNNLKRSTDKLVTQSTWLLKVQRVCTCRTTSFGKL